MDIRQMQFFLTVAKYRNFTTAATELNISQATLSRQILAIEKEMNLLLFIRDNRNVSLTKSGEYLYAELSKLYTNFNQITQNAQSIFQGYNGNLKFGVLKEVTLEGNMQKVLDRYRRHYPNQIIDMQRGSFKELSEGLLNISYDFIISFFFDISNVPIFQYKVIKKVKDGVIISRRNPLSQKPFFHPLDFKEETFIVISKENSTYASTGPIEFCTSHGFYPKIRVASDLDTAMLWVEAGIGLAFTYDGSVATYNPSMKFIPFQEDDHIQESLLVLAWNKQNTNPAIKTFVKNFEIDKDK